MKERRKFFQVVCCTNRRNNSGSNHREGNSVVRLNWTVWRVGESFGMEFGRKNIGTGDWLTANPFGKLVDLPTRRKTSRTGGEFDLCQHSMWSLNHRLLHYPLTHCLDSCETPPQDIWSWWLFKTPIIVISCCCCALIWPPLEKIHWVSVAYSQSDIQFPQFIVPRVPNDYWCLKLLLLLLLGRLHPPFLRMSRRKFNLNIRLEIWSDCHWQPSPSR